MKKKLGVATMFILGIVSISHSTPTKLAENRESMQNVKPQNEYQISNREKSAKKSE